LGNFRSNNEFIAFVDYGLASIYPRITMTFIGRNHLTLPGYHPYNASLQNAPVASACMGDDNDAQSPAQQLSLSRLTPPFNHQVATLRGVITWHALYSHLVGLPLLSASWGIFALGDRQAANLLKPPLRPPAVH
jgi:hypothetical protein